MRPALRMLVTVVLLFVAAPTSRAGIENDTPTANGDFELIVVEAEGCIYCQLFRHDVFPAYAASPQAKDLPVRFVDINDIAADRLDFTSSVDVVPTFVVVRSHREVGRISGYVGPEDFFHSIKYLLAQAP
jgi:thioredoxin-related protein